eukprot:TRINITY_DN12536_c0_g1_i1.p1 TRINITY_DN12536_c0_g1~~TRINITY_DN12536_c0_g1_i1.p1  ORF type:complete len:368 (+),score=96.97 TRINITY_DN12536_c0_g1_i1:51-1106(+)
MACGEISTPLARRCRSATGPAAAAALLSCVFISWAIALTSHYAAAFVTAGAGQLRGARTLRGQRILGSAAAAADDEAAALLAQAEALRKEAEAEEAALQAKRKEQLAAEEVEKEEKRREESAKKETDKVLASAKLSIAEGKLRNLEAAGTTGASLEAARAAVVAAKARLDELNGITAAPPAPAAAAASVPTGAAGVPASPVDLNALGTVVNGRAQPPPGAMDVNEWNELSAKYDKMNWFEQFELNKKLGPQGRRKLLSIRTGSERGKIFVVPGERVRLLSDATAFRKAFSRFQGNSKTAQLNGFSAAKELRRGQECTVQFGYRDKTFNCLFDDGVLFDFPFEVVDGYSEEV